MYPSISVENKKAYILELSSQTYTDNIESEIVSEMIKNQLYQLIKEEKAKKSLLISSFDSILDPVLSNIIREELTFRIISERNRKQTRIRVLFTDQVRSNIIEDFVSGEVRRLLRDELHRLEIEKKKTEAIQEEKEILINETLFEVLREVMSQQRDIYIFERKKEYQRIADLLLNSWVSKQVDFDLISPSGRAILAKHKLTEQITFKKVTKHSLSCLNFSQSDLVLVTKYWNSTQVKKNPFSIASILGKPDTPPTKDPPPPSSPTGGPTVSIGLTPSTGSGPSSTGPLSQLVPDASKPSGPNQIAGTLGGSVARSVTAAELEIMLHGKNSSRRSSILDEILFLQ